jgi:hypothetical protein
MLSAIVRKIRAMERISHSMNPMISEVINHTMFLENILISLEDTGMMMTLGWYDMVHMMIKLERKYGYGVFPGRE